MEILSKDDIWELAKNMDYKTTLRFCSQNRKTRKICEEDRFWKYKLEKQYPDAQLDPELSARDNYILAEAKKLRTEGYKYTTTAFDQDPKYNELYAQEQEILDQIEALQEKLRPVQEEIVDLRPTYEEKYAQLTGTAIALEALVS